MHQVSALLLTLLFLTFTGCEDKKPDQDLIPVENTTSVVMEEKQEEKIAEKQEVESTTTVTVETPEEKVKDTFQLIDMQKESYTAKIIDKGLDLQNNTKSIVLLQFFATWCSPCVGEIGYLNDLQEEYQKDLFIAGVLTRDTIDSSALSTFIKDHHINYKILQNKNDDDLGTYIAQKLNIQGTFPIPLIVIYINGVYYTHYEGSVPVEMVKHDIQQAKKQL